ncbi:MAG: SHOCT domain-containing protein [Geminicoccaceae bacterium]|nr:SHOCT domain-containing protein [Geminicoccaceae bacterium]
MDDMAGMDEALRERVVRIGRRHGIGETAALALFQALAAGGGRMAQFDHPELGGLGQWSGGGMVMIGDMLDHVLRARVNALCCDLTDLVPAAPATAGKAWWPKHLGRPASSGAQDGLRYAFFPEKRRLVVDTGGQVRVYDTGDHAFRGFGQQQGGGTAGLAFTGRHGPVRLDDLPLAGGAEPLVRDDDLVGRIERLVSLRERGLLSETEFTQAKAALLREV